MSRPQTLFNRSIRTPVVVLGVALVVAGSAWLAATDAGSPAATARRPNIVILLADDLGYGDLSSYSSTGIPAPHIDSIAEAGVRLTGAYVTASVCNPSRAGLLTGRYQQRWGQEFNPAALRREPGELPPGSLPRAQRTLAEMLKGAGYATGMVGKWQLGSGEYAPEARGFDETYVIGYGQSYIDTSLPEARFAPEFNMGTPGGAKRNGQPAETDGLLTEVLGREGVEFIDRHREQPFFLYLAFHAPHVPLQTTQKYYDRFPNVDNQIQRVYSAMVSALDDAIGEVLAKLQESGLADNTLVIFFSDNGAAEYIDVDRRRNAPLAGHKRDLYEGGVRIPFMVRWPGRLPAGAVCPHPVTALDIVPTVLAAAGVGIPEGATLDGVDLLPVLSGRHKGPPHEYLFWRMGPNAVVRSAQWKLLKAGERIVRLYDLSADTAEEHDLSKEHPEVAARLLEALARWSAEMAPPRWPGRTIETTHAGDTIEWQY